MLRLPFEASNLQATCYPVSLFAARCKCHSEELITRLDGGQIAAAGNSAIKAITFAWLGSLRSTLFSSTVMYGLVPVLSACLR